MVGIIVNGEPNLRDKAWTDIYLSRKWKPKRSLRGPQVVEIIGNVDPNLMGESRGRYISESKFKMRIKSEKIAKIT